MRLIKLKDGCYIAADDVAEISVNLGADMVAVRTKSGASHSLVADYGKGIYATVQRLVDEVNKAEVKA
jgi:hypothetical protein